MDVRTIGESRECPPVVEKKENRERATRKEQGRHSGSEATSTSRAGHTTLLRTAPALISGTEALECVCLQQGLLMTHFGRYHDGLWGPRPIRASTSYCLPPDKTLDAVERLVSRGQPIVGDCLSNDGQWPRDIILPHANMAASNRELLPLASSPVPSLPQTPTPPARLPPDVWCTILSHLPPTEVMRIRRVNSLFYALALDHRFHHLQIAGIADDEPHKFDALVRFVGAAMSPELAGRIRHITVCMDQLEMLHTFYACTDMGATFAGNVAIPFDRTRAQELAYALFRVVERARALTKVRLVLCGTANRYDRFERRFTQELWHRVPPRAAAGPRAPCGRAVKELSIVIVRYWRRFPRKKVDFRRIHALFATLGPALETLTFKSTIKRLTTSAFANDVVMPALRTLALDVRFGDLKPVASINANYPALTELSLHVWMPATTEVGAPWFSFLHLPTLRILRVALHATAHAAHAAQPAQGDTVWGGTLDAPRLEELRLAGCFTRRATPRDLARVCAFFGSRSVGVLDIEVAEIDDAAIDVLAAAFPAVRALRVRALRRRGREWPHEPAPAPLREFHAAWGMYLRREYFRADLRCLCGNDEEVMAVACPVVGGTWVGHGWGVGRPAVKWKWSDSFIQEPSLRYEGRVHRIVDRIVDRRSLIISSRIVDWVFSLVRPSAPVCPTDDARFDDDLTAMAMAMTRQQRRTTHAIH
ncbi:hypothetical protein PLEOSDRAFT_170671 [Pleurotus ostreatus PC15]|uniref:F-box domain-containing protein n=1 Tax=Pleurotus ostreatus (strain PC15) TaxID=1137138 RepID=A0A067N854_PLEO1|nr:hypothetical protein PLEOSDRAFT_170671 [Pleurotus ostreatus PC15]